MSEIKYSDQVDFQVSHNSKLLLYTDDPGVGGVAQYNHSLILGLSDKGFAVTSVQGGDQNPLLSTQAEHGINHRFLGFNPSLEFARTLTNSEDAKRIFTEDQPELIIFSNCCPFSNFAAKQTALDMGIPYLIVEGFVAPYLANNFSPYLNTLSEHYHYARGVVAVSEENLMLLRSQFCLPEEKGKVIHYGRPKSFFSQKDKQHHNQIRNELSIPADAIVCFTAARLETIKGFKYQLEAIAALKETAIWSKLYFIWAGDGSLKSAIEEEIQRLDVSNQVKLVGQVWDIKKWLDTADIFIFPSELEGMPLAIMEAMAKGLPVMASAISGIPEEMGTTGKLLPDPKIDSRLTVLEMVQTIQEWSEDKELRQSIGKSAQQRALQLFTEDRMIDQTMNLINQALLPLQDYVSDGMDIVRPDFAFPNMIIGNPKSCGWPYLRQNIPHNWYVDQRQPTVGFLSRDEAQILYNTALQFQGKNALEIGCWMGWSACHLALANVKLDVVDPLLDQPGFYKSVSSSLTAAGVRDLVNLVPGFSPQKVEEIAQQLQKKWSLVFIDGNHDQPGPLLDAIACDQLAEEDAIILFHDLASPEVSQGLDYLRDKGWNTVIYQTAQIMGAAWRGAVQPIEHFPDPKIQWELPTHLKSYPVSGVSTITSGDEFLMLVAEVRPYTLLSEERLFSLYSHTKQICLNDIPGNFVECGSFKGGAIALMAAVIKQYSLRPRLLFAFDTFEGMPEPLDIDKHNGIPANETGLGVGTLKAPLAENLEVICQAMHVRDIVRPIQGLFAVTLPEHREAIGDIALLHADGDWYESTMDIFSNLFDRVVPDGIIQVDDYGHWEGCKKALHDFEEMKGEVFKLQGIDYTGVWFQKEYALKFEQVILRKLSFCVKKNQRQKSDASLQLDVTNIFKQLYDWLLCIDHQSLEEVFTQGLSTLIRYINNSDYKDFLIDCVEQELLTSIQQRMHENTTEYFPLNYILSMIFMRPEQLPKNYCNLDEVPNWLVIDYLKFLLLSPSCFINVGDSQKYLEYFIELVGCIHAKIQTGLDQEMCQNIAEVFTERANFIPLYFNNYNLIDIYRRRAEIMEFYYSSISYQLDFDFLNRPSDRNKIKIGILAAQYLPHTETFTTLPFYKHLNRDQFEIILYSYLHTNHRLERYCSGHADEFVILPQALSDQVHLIREADLDILLIATNVTACKNIIVPLALHRLARLQVASTSSCTTTGMRNIDYYLSGHLSELRQDAQEQYSEALVCVEGPAHCQDLGTEENVLSSGAISRKDLGIPTDSVVFISGANFFKIIPELEFVWAEIIASVPGSRLVLYPFNPNWASSYPNNAFKQRILSTFSRFNLSEDQLIILDPVINSADILERLKIADVYLDSYPFSGINSLIDPMRAGIPVVIHDGNSFRSLMGAALLREMQIPELIAENQESYLSLAISLGINAELREMYKDRIITGMKGNPRFLNSRIYSEQVAKILQDTFRNYLTKRLSDELPIRAMSLLVFPNWEISDEILQNDLRSILHKLATHPNQSDITLFVYFDKVAYEDANLVLTGAAMSLLFDEEIDVTVGPEIALISTMDSLSWEVLLSCVQGRIPLEHQNNDAIDFTNANKLPIYQLHESMLEN